MHPRVQNRGRVRRSEERGGVHTGVRSHAASSLQDPLANLAQDLLRSGPLALALVNALHEPTDAALQ